MTGSNGAEAIGVADRFGLMLEGIRPVRIKVFRRGLLLAPLLLLGLTASSRSEVATIDVLLDLDQDSATGCDVATVDGNAEGVELRVRTLFDVGTEIVLSTASAACTDSVLDIFEVDSPIPTAPQPGWQGVAGNGALGSMLIESHVPRALMGQATQARVFVVTSSIVGEDVLFVGAGSGPLVVSIFTPSVPGLGALPLLGLITALLVLGGGVARTRGTAIALVSTISLGLILAPIQGRALLGEGLHRIWSLDERVGIDPEFDAPAGIDLLEFYAAFDAVSHELWFRADILFGAPVCLDWGVVDPGVGFACGMQPPLDPGPFGGAVAMTFDDGPHPVVTPQVLATLRAHGIPATFFVVGKRLNTPEERAIALEIHQDPLFRLGNHSVNHVRMNTLTAEEVDFEVSVNNDHIRAAIGDPCYFPKYFRIPFAASNCPVMTAVRTHGHASAAVHINTSDWCYGVGGGFCFASMVPFIEEEFRDDLPGWAVHEFEASGGGILVMHDIHTNTAAELPAVIAALQAAGATFVDLGDPVLFPLMNETINPPEAPACCSGAVN